MWNVEMAKDIHLPMWKCFWQLIWKTFCCWIGQIESKVLFKLVTYGPPFTFVKLILIEFAPSNHTVRKWIYNIFQVILEQCEIAKTVPICKWICFPILTFHKIEKIASEVCKRQASILRNTTRMWNKAAYRWKIVLNIIQIITV